MNFYPQNHILVMKSHRVYVAQSGLHMEEILRSREDRKRFFASQGLKYLSRTEIQCSRVWEYDWSSSPYYKNNEEEFIRLTAQYGPLIRQEVLAPLYMKFISPSIGWGVFAQAPLNAGDFVGEYTGYITEALEAPPDKTEGGHYLSDFSWNYPDELPDGEEFEITAMNAGNEMRFVNHSFEPNCVVDHTLVEGVFITFFRVIRPIAPDEQLLVDYGEEYWTGGFRQLEVL